MITWRHDDNNQLVTDSHNDLEKIMRRGGRTRRKQNAGGYLRGPSHEQGGILASTNGEMVELEGGEYIINAQTVDALGTPFLDQLNSTQTSYHQGGFQQGQLPGPSQYKRGGRIKKRFQNGGNTGQCIRHQMPNGTIMEGPTHGPGQTCVEWSNNSNGRNNMGYRRGGRPAMRRGGRPVARKAMRRGGATTRLRKGGRPTRKLRAGGVRSAVRTGGRPAMRRGGRPTMRTGGNIRKMPHGGIHNGGPVFCPNGNYGIDEYGNTKCV